jgi:branched-chain amino acid aminotransferase
MTTQQTCSNPGIGFIDGEFMPHRELRLPVTDLGFQLSDMCYDALHVWKGNFFRQDDHMDRWDRSVSERRFTNLDYDRAATIEVLHECVRRSGLREAMVYLVVTRGSPHDELKDLRNCKNRLLAWALPYYAVVTEQEMVAGCDIIVSETVRIPPYSVDPTVKNFGRLDFCRALFEAYDRDAKYALLLDQEGNVTEGRGWNIFALFGGRLVSPESGVLEGVTRRTVLELCDQLNIEGELGRFGADELRRADEVFMSSTAGGIMPVRRIDSQPVGSGTPGPVTKRLTEMYWALHDDPAYTTPVDYRDER